MSSGLQSSDVSNGLQEGGSREPSGNLPIPPALDASCFPDELDTGSGAFPSVEEDEHIKQKESTQNSAGGSDRDFYDVLGLQRVCEQDEVRRAYRTLAKVVHPDKLHGKGMEADEFRKITEAYAALSNPARRAEYDKGGKEGLRRYDIEQEEELVSKKRRTEEDSEHTLSLLEKIFGAPTGGQMLSNVQRAGSDTMPADPGPSQCVEKPLLVTLEELALGTTKRFKVASSSNPTGSEMLQVKITPGWTQGTRLLFPKKGGRPSGSPSDHPPRDLVFIITEAPHEHFQREGDSLVTEIPVPLITALCGGTLHLPQFANRPLLTINIHHGANLDNPLVISGAGMPNAEGGPNGDLRVTFKVVLPVGLSDTQRDDIQKILLEVVDDTV